MGRWKWLEVRACLGVAMQGVRESSQETAWDSEVAVQMRL